MDPSNAKSCAPKISLEKEELGEMVEKYNKLVSPNKSIQLQEVESGNFPWKTENNDEDGKLFVLKGLSLLSIE